MTRPVDVIGLLEAGIKAEGLRQQTIASNIANVETPGYRRLDVRFQDLLARAAASSDPDVEQVRPEVYQPGNTPIRANGNDVQLEAEIGALVKNTLRHTAYARLLRKKLSQIATAAGVGG